MTLLGAALLVLILAAVWEITRPPRAI